MLTAFIAGVGLISGIVTIYLFLKDLPVVTTTLAKIRLPYWFWQRMYLNRIGITTLEVSNTLEDHLEIEKFLYNLHGYYKTLGITNSGIGTLGTPAQFRHLSEIDTREFEKMVRRFLPAIISVETYDEIDFLLKLWSPYLSEVNDSRILEIVQTCVLIQLGYCIPIDYKKPLIKFIRNFFLSKYYDERKKNRKYLDDMQTALSKLIVPKLRSNYQESYIALIERYSYYDNFSKFLEIVELLHDTIEIIEINL